MSTNDERALADSWTAVTTRIGKLATELGRQRGVEVRAMGTADGRQQFAVMSLDRGALVMTLIEAEQAVACHWELAGGNAWWCRYRIEDDGAWTGPLAAGAESRRIADPDEAARDVVTAGLRRSSRTTSHASPRRAPVARRSCSRRHQPAFGASPPGRVRLGR